MVHHHTCQSTHSARVGSWLHLTQPPRARCYLRAPPGPQQSAAALQLPDAANHLQVHASSSAWLTCSKVSAGNALYGTWPAAMPLRVTPKGSAHLADPIWRAEPPLDERTHLAGMASRRPEGTSARAPRATTSLNKVRCPPTTSLNKLWPLTAENAPLSTLEPFP